MAADWRPASCARLDSGQLEQAYAQGMALSLKEAIDLVL